LYQIKTMRLKEANIGKVHFLFLMDFSKGSYAALDSLIKLAKKTNGTIEIVYIPVAKDHSIESNALTVMRELEVVGRKINRQLVAIKEQVESENIDVSISIEIGNIVSEIETKRILSSDTKTIVIGKETDSQLKTILKYLTTKYKGSVLVLEGENSFEEGEFIAIGCTENSLSLCDLKLPVEYSKNNGTPIIVLQSNYLEDQELEKVIHFSKNDSIEILYKTIHHSKLVLGIKEFLKNNQVKILCISRDKTKNSLLNRLLNPNKTITELINEINIPILIMENNKI